MDESHVGKKVAVIGGGISGLASAYYLARGGSQVTLIESGAQLGGLGSFFQYGEHTLERFYHCMLPTDKHLLALLDELDLESETYWRETSFGMMHQGKLFGLNTPVELLKFSPLPLIDRLRVGITGLWGSLCSSNGLDDVTCETWLTTLSGQRAFDTFWKPMLQAKFGDRYGQVPALWFWTRFNREKGAKKERKGYLHGGYKRIIDAISASLNEQGVEIRMNCPVSSIGLNAEDRPQVSDSAGRTTTYDQLVYTAPAAHLHSLLGTNDSLRRAIGEPVEMQGVINAVLLLRRGFTSHYWVATVDDDVPFQGIVESTALLDKADSAGHHLIYLMNYVHRSDPLFSTSDDAILTSYMDGMRKLFPDFTPEDVIDSYVFRSPFVEPIYNVGYLNRQPPGTLVPGRIYLATSAQVYPQVTSWNGSVGLARQIVGEMLVDQRK